MCFQANAQKKHSAKFKKVFALAEKNFEYGYYDDALKNYLKIYSEDTMDVELNYKIALCHYYEKHHPDSIVNFLMHDDASNIPDVQLLLGKLFHRKHNFKEAKAHYEKYKKFPASKRSIKDDEINRLINISDRAEAELKTPHTAIIKNLGSKINTKNDEYVPLPSVNGNKLFFTSKRPGGIGNLKDVAGNYFEDIYVSDKEGLGWSEPVNLGKPINSKDHDACVTISVNGKYMLLYRPAKNNIGGDIYESFYENNKWTEPSVLGTNINSKEGNESSACISSDGNYLIFSSNKKGGFGGKDLYMCKKLPNGNWSKANNLGKEVNTPFDEDAPYMMSNDRTVYFSSRGHSTIGGFDVFRSEYNSENNSWSIPENLGYPINNVGDDIFFVMSSDEKRGFYSSEKDEGFGGEDIYQIELLYNENEIHTRKISVYEFGSEKTKPIKAKAVVKDNSTNQISGNYQSRNNNGRLIIDVKPYHNYSVTLQSEGYNDFTFELDQLKPDNEGREISIELKKK
ncbi:MAG: hypothetical protein ACK452_09960 [Bacteroidota bacterium]